MASRKFRFVSPGVFLKEIDNSQIPKQAEGVGPVLIGRTRQGPAMKPYKIRSLEEFERVFGLSMPGNQGNDPWRDGTDLLAESYLPYAARAYLSADIDSPITVIRLAGVNGPNAQADSDGETGWKASNAYGLFFYNTGSAAAPAEKIDLAAVFYGTHASMSIQLRGQQTSGSATHTAELGQPVMLDSSTGKLTLIISGSTNEKEITFLPSEIRKSFNTNPVATNSNVITPLASSLANEYWLGESFDETIRMFEATSAATERAAVVLKLNDSMADFQSTNHELVSARSGWIIGQDLDGNTSTYDAAEQEKLFRILALQEGSRASSELVIGIEDIKIPREGQDDQYGTFSVVVKKIISTGLVEVERFDNCNLDPNSNNYVAKMIGDQYMKWDSTENRNKIYGTNPNISEYVRVEMDPAIEQNGRPSSITKVPFGFLGPVRPKTLTARDANNNAGAALGGWVQTAAKIADDIALDVTASWADFPLVNTASIDDNYYLGASPYKMTYDAAGSGSTVSDEINPGYIDLGRRLSALTGLTTDQDDGVADGTNSEHAFKFTLDDVVLERTAASALASNKEIQNAAQVKRVVHVEGSRTGFHATASIDFTANPVNGDTIAITDTNGTQATFQVVGGVATADGSKNGSGNIIVGLSGLGDADGTAFATRFATVVNAQTDISVTATNDEAKNVILKQTVKGTLGDRAIDDSNLQNATVDGTGFVGGASTSFSGLQADAGFAGHRLRPLTEIVKGFHVPLVGGFDGTNVTESNPFNNRVLEAASGDSGASYAYASVERAIEMIKDPEALEHNLAVMPGITEETLTTKLVRACENRADSLAIIDLPNVYVPPSQQRYSEFSLRLKTTPEATAAALVKRQLNSSYGASYYPWVKVRDELFTRDVWVPPSVVALGVMAYTEQQAAVWFAPAGFNRGGLNEGNAGLPVLQVTEQLTSKNRDTLYEANVNPIASFVSEGLVIFGQKTLQSSQSALDRINVRRLLIFIKKEVSRISNNLLFEQNVQATWDRFKNQVVPFLAGIRTRFGLEDYRVILDNKTTTPDLVDRNIMYAKILLKPAKSIEFIAVDFVITRSGASFED